MALREKSETKIVSNSIGRSPSKWLIILFFLARSAFPHTAIPRSPRIIIGKIDKVGVDRLIREMENPSIIVMMASWCAPCIKELPSLIKIYGKYRPLGLRMVGLSFEIGGPTAIQGILDRLKVNFPVYLAGEEILRAYNISAIPMLFFIKNGQIVEKIIGNQTEEFLNGRIGEFLK